MTSSSKPWLTAAEATEHVGSKTVKAFGEWARRHFILRRGNGKYARVDLDRALKAKRQRRHMHPHSLDNLRRRHVKPEPIGAEPYPQTAESAVRRSA